MWKWEKFVVFSSPETDKVWRVPYSEFASAPDEYIARAKADGFQLWEYEQVYVPPEPCERPSKHQDRPDHCASTQETSDQGYGTLPGTVSAARLTEETKV